ncbi:MAG: substrate-binding domain-containing protein [Candidatus Riflebacteria bacterium]|nr:substrate-binding domain-containing protein [Candidatus Riflebacteria bacterium]
MFFLSVQLHAENDFIKMSTTTSTQDSGILDFLLPQFEKESGIAVKVIAKGTGGAIKDGIDGNVDAILVHAKEKEEEFIKDGYSLKRYPVMHNDFIILGSASDSAGIKNSANAADAMKKIAAAQAIFISRGDESGTHIMERKLWKKADTDIESIQKKGEKWYLSAGQGMGKTLLMANEKQAYTISDRSTYLKYKFGSNAGFELEILYEGDPQLFNQYAILPINPAKHAHVKHDLVSKFITWMTSEKTRNLISEYKIHGKSVFTPDSAD